MSVPTATDSNNIIQFPDKQADVLRQRLFDFVCEMLDHTDLSDDDRKLLLMGFALVDSVIRGGGTGNA